MITITSNVISNGKYSAYLPLEVECSHSDNPDYLDFELIEDDDTSLGLPKIRAYKLSNNRYRVDFNAQMKTLYNVREAKLSTTAIEVISIYFLKVKITDPIEETSAVESNSFYSYPFLDTTFVNNETAKNGYNKEYLFSETPTPPLAFLRRFRDRIRGGYSRVNMRPQIVGIGSIFQLFEFDLTSVYDENDIVSIPVGSSMLTYDGTDVSLWGSVDATNPSPLIDTNTIIFSIGDLQKTLILFNPATECNLKEFVFINRFGVADNYHFKTYENEKQATKSDEFFKYEPLSNNGANFEFGTQSEKINQRHSKEFLVDEYFVPYADKERLIDFIKSPVHWLNDGGNLVKVVMFDAKYNVVSKSRGVKFTFKYKLSQKEISFI